MIQLNRRGQRAESNFKEGGDLSVTFFDRGPSQLQQAARLKQQSSKRLTIQLSELGPASELNRNANAREFRLGDRLMEPATLSVEIERQLAGAALDESPSRFRAAQLELRQIDPIS